MKSFYDAINNNTPHQLIMRFSIIVPSYNSDRFLEETLQSIFIQKEDGVEIELIVIDGKSSDNTPRILAKYANEIDQLVIEDNVHSLLS